MVGRRPRTGTGIAFGIAVRRDRTAIQIGAGSISERYSGAALGGLHRAGGCIGNAEPPGFNNAERPGLRKRRSKDSYEASRSIGVWRPGGRSAGTGSFEQADLLARGPLRSCKSSLDRGAR